MVGVVSPSTEFLCLTQNSAMMGFLNCYDVTCYEFDSNNNILWVGNSLGELFGYVATFSPSMDNGKDKKDKSKATQESTASFRDPKQVIFNHVTDNTDPNTIKNLIYSIPSIDRLIDFKSLFYYFLQVASCGSFRTDSSLFECKCTLTSLTEEFMFTTEGSRLDLIKSSYLSNIIIAADQRSTITIWDVYDKCLLVRVHPPHFSQSILVQMNEEKRILDFRRYLNKDFVTVQQPVAISISSDNEDFAVISQDFVSVYSCSGVLIANERTNGKQNRFTSVCIAQVDLKLTRNCLLLRTTTC